MAVNVYRGTSAPTSYIKLYRANWLLNVDTAGSSALYSTDQGGTWCRIDHDSGKIELKNSYLYVQDIANFYVYEMPPSAIAILES